MIKKLASPMLAAAALALFVTGSATAQGLVPDQRTFFTFSAPVQLPGVTLPAGKYTFRLADSQSNRHIVQVFNADGTKIITTLFAIAAQRSQVPENPEIQFLETPAEMAPAIDVWWYPGTKLGHEFVYSKDAAAKFAKAKSGAEKYAKGEVVPSSMKFENGDVTVTPGRPATPAPVTNVERASPPAPVSAPAVAAAVRPNTPVADSSAMVNTRKALPHTASLLPAIGLIGVLSLFAGVMVATRRRSGV